MGFDGLFNLIDIIIFACGFYALYSAYVLQRDGKIIRTFLVFKDTKVEDCTDLQGYANFMGPRLWTLGIIMILYGAASLINTYVVNIGTLFGIMMVLFLISLFWYSMEVKKAMARFFSPQA